MVIHFLVVPIPMSTHGPMMEFATLLSPLHKMLTSMWDENYMNFFQPFLIPPIDELTLSSLNMESTP